MCFQVVQKAYWSKERCPHKCMHVLVAMPPQIDTQHPTKQFDHLISISMIYYSTDQTWRRDGNVQNLCKLQRSQHGMLKWVQALIVDKMWTQACQTVLETYCLCSLDTSNELCGELTRKHVLAVLLQSITCKYIDLCQNQCFCAASLTELQQTGLPPVPIILIRQASGLLESSSYFKLSLQSAIINHSVP